jgi:IS30 family transposase
MEKKRPGRKKKLLNDPDTLNKIIALGSQGLTSGQIARCLGVSWSTIDRRRKENAEIEEAIKKGEALGVEKISNALMTSARDGNVTAQIFYLKNRAPDQWADRQERYI